MRRKRVMLGYGSSNPDIRKTNNFLYFYSLRSKGFQSKKTKRFTDFRFLACLTSLFCKRFSLAASLKLSFAVEFIKILTAVRLGMCWECCLSHWPTVSLLLCSSICLSFSICHFLSHSLAVSAFETSNVFARCFVQHLHNCSWCMSSTCVLFHSLGSLF